MNILQVEHCKRNTQNKDSKPMKIAILSPFYPYRGGIAQFSLCLFRELRKTHEVKVFSFSRLYPDFLFPGKTQFVEGSKPLTDAPSERVLDSINPLTYERTVRHIAKFKPDILVIAYWMSFFAPASAYIARRLKKRTKVIALIHNAIPHEPRRFDRTLASLFFKQCSRYVVLSEAVKTDVLSICPEANCLICPHPLYDHFGAPVDRLKARQALGLDAKSKTLLFFGLIREYKGLDMLINAMQYLDSSYRLIIAGECYGDFGKYRQQIDKSPAKNRILTFTRYISDEEAPVLFSAADLLVAPYRSATQSGVIPVACHFELPVLVTDVGGLRETVEKPGIGLVCLPSAGNIADGIKSFFATGARQFKYNIKKEKERLSWSKFAEQLTDFATTYQPLVNYDKPITLLQ